MNCSGARLTPVYGRAAVRVGLVTMSVLELERVRVPVRGRA
ncbi:hypothetical protein [Mycetohabitans rhizoxinica]